MKKLTAAGLCLLGSAGMYLWVQAGNLEPPDSPSPTMVTLQQIYDKLDGCCGGSSPCGVPKTGQTECWDWDGGPPIACAGTGQDGEVQAGVSVEPRFTDNGDGTVKDNLTGLTWLKNANCFDQKGWPAALSDANTLASGSCGLTDGSVAGDWRLPNVRELQSLIEYGQYDPALPSDHPFYGVAIYYYWSSTSHEYYTSQAWNVYSSFGNLQYSQKTSLYFVWPVRGGQ